MIRGRVQNGVVVLETQGALREGTEVAVEPLPRAPKEGKAVKRPTVRRALANLAGKAKHLPPDAARNLE
ncbi:MAG: hypothetical protein ACLQLG_07165 [Thermoguttaceae bacterium]